MGSLTVYVLDYKQKPVRGKKVYCNFVGSLRGITDTHSEEYTDANGVAEFDDVPVGEVDVFVNGEKQLSISVGQNDYEDVTVTV